MFFFLFVRCSVSPLFRLFCFIFFYSLGLGDGSKGIGLARQGQDGWGVASSARGFGNQIRFGGCRGGGSVLGDDGRCAVVECGWFFFFFWVGKRAVGLSLVFVDCECEWFQPAVGLVFGEVG